MDYDYIKCGDCLELMQQLPSKSVDISFTSPPYNDIGTENTTIDTIGSGNTTQINTHRKYIHVERRKDWFEWLCDCIDEMLRVSKKYVLLNIQGIKNNRADLYKIIGKYSNIIHDILIWYKPNGCPTGTPHKLSNKYEMVLILKCDGVDGVSVNSNYYTNVIVQNVNDDKSFIKEHKAVMSKQFCDEIIKEFTVKGDIVLDPFFGVGTTGLSCKKQGRHYIGFDIEQRYCNIAEERIANGYWEEKTESKKIQEKLF